MPKSIRFRRETTFAVSYAIARFDINQNAAGSYASRARHDGQAHHGHSFNVCDHAQEGRFPLVRRPTQAVGSWVWALNMYRVCDRVCLFYANARQMAVND